MLIDFALRKSAIIACLDGVRRCSTAKASGKHRNQDIMAFVSCVPLRTTRDPPERKTR